MATRALQLGTRASALARWQAEWVAARLLSCGHAVDLVPITTQGDVVRGSLGEAGGVGLFTKELQHALLDGRIDLAVHSLKDLPTEHVPGLALAGVPPRESVCDVLLSRDGLTLASLPYGAVVGTGSLRRRAQALHRRPDLRFIDIRGNVDTRVRKLQSGQYDAIILAEAGLNRLQLTAHVTQVLSPLEMLPAVGQGALGIEARANDQRTRTAVEALNDPATHAAVLAERSLLLTLLGGCLAPVGAWGRATENGQLELDAVVLSADGKQRLAATARTADLADAVDLGKHVAETLLAQGAALLIQQSRRA
jgi:hydroxymethylbilane synthase